MLQRLRFNLPPILSLEIKGSLCSLIHHCNTLCFLTVTKQNTVRNTPFVPKCAALNWYNGRAKFEPVAHVALTLNINKAKGRHWNSARICLTARPLTLLFVHFFKMKAWKAWLYRNKLSSGTATLQVAVPIKTFSDVAVLVWLFKIFHAHLLYYKRRLFKTAGAGFSQCNFLSRF